MPSTDWGRLDNQAYMPANDFKAMITQHAIGVAKGLESSMNPVIKQSAGGKAKAAKKPKITNKKVMVGNRKQKIYEGPKGGKYVMRNGKLVPYVANGGGVFSKVHPEPPKPKSKSPPKPIPKIAWASPVKESAGRSETIQGYKALQRNNSKPGNIIKLHGY